MKQWEKGCPEKNLMKPLKQWPKGSRSTYLKSVFHDRKLIALEYLKLGETCFTEKYKPDEITVKKLKKLIRDSVE